MNKFLKGLLVAALCLGTQVADAANIKDFPRVAVMNFGNKAITSRGLREHDFSSASEYAIYQLSASGWFDLVDYEQLSTIAKMHNVNMSGLVDPATVVAMGKFAGAEFMVIGNLTGLTTKENVLAYQHGGRGGIENAQHVVTANVTVRIVDIETGRIVVAGLGKGSSTSTHTELSFKKFRNRKIETEEISDTVTTDLKDEILTNIKTNNNTSSSKITNNNRTNSNTQTNSSTNSNSKEEKQTANTENSSTTGNRETITSSDNYSDNTTSNSNVVTNKELENGTMGDVNGDGVVNQADINALKLYLIDNYDDYIDLTNADIDGSGKVDLTDLSQLKVLLQQQNTKTLVTTGETITVDNNKVINKGGSSSKEIENNNTNTITNSSGKETTISNNTSNSQENITNNTDEYTDSYQINTDSGREIDETTNKVNNQNRVQSSNKSIQYERETEDYVITIGTVEVSDIQVRNAISKAVRDAIYGNMGILTTLNGGKKLKIKTGF